MADVRARNTDIEWPTLALLAACYTGWVLATTWLAAQWLPLAMVAGAILIALHSSLTHEALHGHPFRKRLWNEMTVFPCLGLFVPYRRFRDLHLAHHRDSILTDPYDDPESNYMDPEIWSRLPGWLQWLLRVNNTLLGRLIFGPAFSLHALLRDDWRAIRRGDWAVLQAWLIHVSAILPVLLWVHWSPMPVWAYLAAAYAGFSILKIRTFLEHRAHERASGRTVVIEDRGPLALIFLNNNLHAVHHKHPRVAWYRLPRLFAENRESYLTLNDSYYYRSYAEIFRRHFFRAKDPVPHPLWPRR